MIALLHNGPSRPGPIRTGRRMALALSGLAMAPLLVLPPAANAAPPAASAASAADAPGEAAAWHYRIQPGDTLIALTRDYLVEGSHWRMLARLNRIADPLRLPPGGTLRMPLSLLRSEASVAQALFTQGEVQLLRGSAAPTALAAGAELRSGDRLRTLDQSSVTLRFADGSRLLLAPRSEVRIEQLLVYGRSALPLTRLRLEQGSADNRVQPRPDRPPLYEMRAPQLNLGVRGTEFRVQVDEGRESATSRAQVLAGAVAARGAGAALRLEAGQGVVAGAAGLQTAALLPPPDLAGLPRRIERLPLQLSWPPMPGALAWRAQVYAEGDFERLLLDSRTPGPSVRFAVRTELPDGRYSLRLRAIDALGLEGRAADAVFVLKARPEPPFATAPNADARLYGDAVELGWTRSAQARRYRLQLAASADFAQPLIDRQDLDGSTLRVALPPGQYHWRLASIAGENDQGPFGDAQPFTLRPLPPSPPPAEPQIDGEKLQLRWAAAPGVARYQLQLARDPGFEPLLTEATTEAPSITLDRPGPGRYHLRVRSLDADGQAGPWGATQLIEVPGPRWLWLIPLALLLVL